VAAILLDTNILLRMLEGATSGALVRQCLRTFSNRGEDLYFTSQNMIEFWNGCTRPADRNGLGLSIAETEARAAIIERRLRRLPEDDRIYSVWRSLVREHSVSGAQVHDARLAAAMTVHQVPFILTFNGRDFARYPGISVLDPHETANER
jgi:predicted nucleic acid-binding protein